MKILALDTATEACSAALCLDGQLSERFQWAPREHNRLILPMIEDLLAEAGIGLRQLDALAVGRGPGSFTGVRIAVGVAQGLAFGADLPIVPLSTLAAMAYEALAETGADFAFPCIDARMAEVYWSVYVRDAEFGVVPVVDECVVAPGQVSVHDTPAGVGIGSGWATYHALLSERLGGRLVAVLPDRFPRAAAIASLAALRFPREGGVAAEDALPVYLRDQVAKIPGSG